MRAAGGEIWRDKTLEDWPAASHRLFVGDLEKNTREHHVRDLFKPFKSVDKIRVVMRPQSTYNRGYAFVSMSDKDEYLQALKSMNGALIRGRPCTVRASTAEERTISKDKA